MKIGIAFDLAPTDPALCLGGPDDRFEEFDKPETVEALAGVIRAEGHDVTLLGDGREFLTKILNNPPDFVFNIAEGEGVGRSREARVPAVLEMLGIPYSGSDPLTLAASLDKQAAHQLVRGVPYVNLPASFVIPLAPDGRDWVDRLVGHFPCDDRPFPLILKPAFEGSSKGIRGTCIADNLEEARTISENLLMNYQQPVVVEEFIDGDEVTVGIVGNGPSGGLAAQVIGLMRIIPKQTGDRFVYSLEVKRDWENRVTYEAPAVLDEQVEKYLSSSAMAVYQALGCRDLARIDFRVRDGIPYFIEANPLPGLAPVTSDLVILARGHGFGYPELIRRILRASLTRVGLK